MFILTLLFIVTSAPISYAETNSTTTTRINAEADVYVQENKPYKNSEGTFHNYAGHTVTNGTIVSYLKFDITLIPNSNLLHDVVIDSASLRLLMQLVNGSTDTACVTVSYCTNNAWTPSNITWQKRVCSNSGSLKGMDSNVVREIFLPGIYSWDVLEGVVNAREVGLPISTSCTLSFLGIVFFLLHPFRSLYLLI